MVHRYTPASSLKVILPTHTLPRPAAPSAPPVFDLSQDQNWLTTPNSNDSGAITNGNCNHFQNILLNDWPNNGSSNINAQPNLCKFLSAIYA